MLNYVRKSDPLKRRNTYAPILGLLVVGSLVSCKANMGLNEKVTQSNLIDTNTTYSLSRSTPPDNQAFLPAGIDIYKVSDRLNQERLPRHLPGFTPDERLMQAARNHASYMSRNGVYGHEFGPETKFQKRIFAVGFHNSAGENIGVGYRDLDAAFVGWMGSSGHRRNMLKRKYSVFGFAYARNISGKNPRFDHFWVLIMGAAGGKGQVPQMGFNPL